MSKPHPLMTGLFALLTPEQQAALRNPTPEMITLDGIPIGPRRLDNPAPARVQNMETRTSNVTQQVFRAFCERQGIRVNHRRFGRQHIVTLHAPDGRIFAGPSGGRQLEVWNDEESQPDWNQCYALAEAGTPFEKDWSDV